eukprot:12869437-Alexandrium_andersonii.AAC.1
MGSSAKNSADAALAPGEAMVSSAIYTASMTGDRAHCPQSVPHPTCMLPLPSVAVWACRDR